jgi:flavin reductase (DIM6/NTAB) family NADH-FMN oxidoreductase RutF
MEAYLAHNMKNAMRRLGSGVVLVTTEFEGRRTAMLATAVNSLSLDPPSLLLCVNKAATIFSVLTSKRPFCVNILGESHLKLARHCSSTEGADRFREGKWLPYVNGVPYLADSIASFFCGVDVTMEYGSHGIFIGRVSEILTGADEPPLLYLDGNYCYADKDRPLVLSNFVKTQRDSNER